MRCKALRQFSYASDSLGLYAKEATKGQWIDVPDSTGQKLLSMGYAELETAADDFSGAGDVPVSIPNDWEILPWPELRSLASSISDEPIRNKQQSVDAIESELARRLVN